MCFIAYALDVSAFSERTFTGEETERVRLSSEPRKKLMN